MAMLMYGEIEETLQEIEDLVINAEKKPEMVSPGNLFFHLVMEGFVW
ncbi:MAG: hypothetical protein VB050_13165 [Geobacteraceae bacterium]|nr:hypothetical protein [Geobacteraceae bacterium]